MSDLTVKPGETRIGWIGTGVMGASMCGHLIDAGFSATVFTRTKSRAQRLIDNGAKWADTPKAVAENSDIVFSIVGFPTDVREVILGDDGALAGNPTMEFCSKSTTPPFPKINSNFCRTQKMACLARAFPAIFSHTGNHGVLLLYQRSLRLRWHVQRRWR